MENAIKKADILIEALPYIREFRGRVFVIKYGGSILSEESIRKGIVEDIVFLHFMGIKIVLVHGGGINISEKMRQRKIEPRFYKGMRITDSQALEVVQQELGFLRNELKDELEHMGVEANALSGEEDLLYVSKKKAEVDLGFVGDMESINKERFNLLLNEYGILIVSPMGRDRDGVIYNINADEVASFVSAHLNAEMVVFLTNVRGIMRDPEDLESFISSINEKRIEHMVEAGTISEGMLPKVKAGLYAIDRGTKKAHIVDAKIPHAILLEIFTTEGIGTEIVR